MSYFDRANASSKPAQRRAPKAAADWVTKPLSNSQKATLSIAGKAAWEIQHQAGLTDSACDDWRHEQVFIACGKAGLREATNKHYRAILAHFQRLCGQEQKAQSTWAKTGRVQGSTEAHDTHENREVARAILRDLIASSQGLIGEGYVDAISRSKFAAKTPPDLAAAQLQELVITVRERLRKKLRSKG